MSTDSWEKEYSDIEIKVWEDREGRLKHALASAGLNPYQVGIVVSLLAIQFPSSFEALCQTFEYKDFLQKEKVEGKARWLEDDEVKALQDQLNYLVKRGIVLQGRSGFHVSQDEIFIRKLRELPKVRQDFDWASLQKILHYMAEDRLSRGWFVDGVIKEPIPRPITGVKHIESQEELRAKSIEILEKVGTVHPPGMMKTITEAGTWLAVEPYRSLLQKKAASGAEMTVILALRPEAEESARIWDKNVLAMKQVRAKLFVAPFEKHNEHMNIVDDHYAIYFQRKGLSVVLTPWYTDRQRCPEDLDKLLQIFEHVKSASRRVSF